MSRCLCLLITLIIVGDIAVCHEIPRNETDMNLLCVSSFDGTYYTFEVDDDGLEKGSVWGDGERLRYSPKAARGRALEWINKNLSLVDTRQFHWKCNSLRLIDAGNDTWFWIADFEYMIRVGGSTGIPYTFSVPVLADGVVPMPIQKKIKPR